MATLTIGKTDQPLVRRALDRGIRVLEQLAPELYLVSSSREGVQHRVWARNGKANCTCELSTLGHKRCPHGAIVLAWIAWQRAQEGGAQ